MQDSECQQLLAQLSEYVEGEAGQEICRVIEHHLEECGNCRIVVDTLRRTIALYREYGAEPLPEGVQSRLYTILDLRVVKGE